MKCPGPQRPTGDAVADFWALRTGDRLRVDGMNGTVEIIDRPAN